MELRPEELAAYRSPFDDLLGVRLSAASEERVVASLTVRPELFQPHGLVHGGVYAAVIEGAAAVGANLWLGEEAVAVGVSNHTDFLRAVSEGDLTARATPLQRGQRLQLWQVTMTDESERLVAHGTVKLANLPRDQQ